MKTIGLFLALFAGSTCMAAQYEVTSHSPSPANCLPYYGQNAPVLHPGDVVEVDWSASGVIVESKSQGLTGHYPQGTYQFGGLDLGSTTNEFVSAEKMTITYEIGPGTNIVSGGFLLRSGNQLIVNSGASKCELTLK